MQGLRDLRVVDFSNRIAGAYATKLLADAYAEVIKVEPPDGDALRRWTASDQDLDGKDGALFQFLNTSKKSVVGAIGDDHVDALLRGADLVIETSDGAIDGKALTEQYPGLTVLSISDYGLDGPLTGTPSADLVVQANSGGLAGRGLQSMPPVMCGGQTTEWIGGTYSAVAGLAAARRARANGQGEHIDFSLCEVMNIGSTTYADLMDHLNGRPEPVGAPRSVEVPSIEPTKDGWVGFNTNSNQQFTDFLLLIERPDLLEDTEWAMIGTRMARMDEWNEIVRSWTTQHTTEEIVERASLLRIPVAPVCSGRTVLDHIHLKERGVFKTNPTGGFQQPRSPYLMDGEEPRPFEPVPTLGEHQDAIESRERLKPGISPSGASDPDLPLKGIRVIDTTAWWAGPSACQMLANLGADVIKVEAIQRPDGMRMMGGLFIAEGDWWERSAITLAANTNKRGLTLNLSDPKGLEICKKLIEEADVFIENFSPRVVENFGLDWENIHKINPKCIVVRMPAFGLSGPWRDNVGFAQTMEQISGLAWITGHADDQPRIQRGPCDPLAGMHAAFATQVALAEREKTGQGHLLECTMVEGALNAASELAIEWSAYGVELSRDGNRGPQGAPQNVYACAGEENWLALVVRNDAQWTALKGLLGNPAWAEDEDLATHAGRRRKHGVIDDALGSWLAGQDLNETIAALHARGIPAGPVWDSRKQSEHPQFIARGFMEDVDHPIVGTHPVVRPPFKFATVDRWNRTPAPTMGQHNEEVLREMGLSPEEIAQLEADEVIGTKPKGL
ncbi:MAG: CoA transferase [Deltaproteobacteria bacterium]|nr:CoA transferase [Deltaproteobacteria bacterium]